MKAISKQKRLNPMQLESCVVFNCEIPVFGGHAIKEESFKTIDELKATIKEYHQSDTPYKITVIRNVNVVDKNNKNNVNCTVTSEKIYLYVCDKLIYPADAQQILLKKYGRVFDFDAKKCEENTPLKNLHVSEHKTVGLRIGYHTSEFHWHSVYFEQAGPNDIIVNSNLQQMWPKNTGRTPNVLTKMLARKKEIIR